DDGRQALQRDAAVAGARIDIAPGEVGLHVFLKTPDSRLAARCGQTHVVGEGSFVGVPAAVEAGEVHEDPRARVRALGQPRVPEGAVDLRPVLAGLATSRAQLPAGEGDPPPDRRGRGRGDLFQQALLEVLFPLAV